MHQEVVKSSGRDYTVSLIRFLAFLSIVFCHTLQYFSHPLANWLNVGVQVFLCISGFLYANKKISSPLQFYKKQFKKILIPFWIVFIPYLATYLYILQKPLEGGIITGLRAFFAGVTIPGATHLWFVGTILVCYLLTPVLVKIFQQLPVQPKKFAKNTIFISAAIFIIFWSFFPKLPTPSWIVCYTLGVMIGYAIQNKIFTIGTLTRAFGILAASNISQIILQTHFQLNFHGIAEEAFKHWIDLNHVWLGIFLFLLLKQLFAKFSFKHWLIKLCKISDSCSYEAYLVHQFVILNSLSLLAVTPILSLNIALAIIAVIVLTVVVKLIEKPLINNYRR